MYTFNKENHTITRDVDGLSVELLPLTFDSLYAVKDQAEVGDRTNTARTRDKWIDWLFRNSVLIKVKK